MDGKLEEYTQNTKSKDLTEKQKRRGHEEKMEEAMALWDG